MEKCFPEFLKTVRCFVFILKIMRLCFEDHLAPKVRRGTGVLRAEGALREEGCRTAVVLDAFSGQR